MSIVSYAVTGATLERFFAADDFVRVLVGPFGSGKTSACCSEMFRRACEQAPGPDGVRRSKAVVVRSTFRQLHGTTVQSWRSWFGDRFGRFSWSEPYEHHLRFSMPDGTKVESDVTFLALDGPDSETKLRGLEVTFGWINECRELARGPFNVLLGRIGRFPPVRDGGPTWSGLIGDTNPFDVDHFLYRLLVEGSPQGWALFKQPGGVVRSGDEWVANPAAENLGNLPANYYARQLPGQRDDWIAVNLAGEFGYVQDGKPVFPEYSDSLHCASEPFPPLPGAPVVLGLDFGLTPACVIAQQSARGQWRICDELVAEDMGLASFGELLAQRLAQWYPGFDRVTAWGDPAGIARSQTDEQTAFQVLAAKLGRVVRPASTNALHPRLEAVRAPLRRLIDGKPGFLISPHCKQLRKALLGGYRFNRVQIANSERYRDVPDKNEFSHVSDALQYLMLGGGEVRSLTRRRDEGSRPTVARTEFNVWGSSA